MKRNEGRRLNQENVQEEKLTDILVGRNPVMEALKAERPINKILVAGGERKGSIKEIIGLAKERHIVIQEVNSAYLNQLSKEGNHQGIVAMISPFAYVEVDDLLEMAGKKGENAFVILADGITDPYNLGALIRTAEAAGAHGLVIPKRNSSPVTSTVAKASAGAIEYLPVARETNIVRCIEYLKKEGLWIVGADADGQTILYDVDLKVPIALVVGGEDKGVGRLVKEHCDIVTSIPMKGHMSSLNASVAGAVLMYEVLRQRRKW